MLSEKAVTEYMEIYKREFGKELSREQAMENGTKLLHLFKIIYRPLPKSFFKRKK